MSDERCGEPGERGRCQFRAGHGGLRTLIWESTAGDGFRMLHTWSGPDDGSSSALDYPYIAAVRALDRAPGYPKIELRG